MRRLNPDRASNVLIAYTVGLLALGLLDPHGDDWSQFAQDGMSVLLEGVQR